MNIISQINLFEESDYEFLGDLERLERVVKTIDDAKLIDKLHKIRGNGRNDWPCEAMWNSFIASFLLGHDSVESLLRELRRNKQLRTICGFTPKNVRQPDGKYKTYVAPSSSSYSKFLKNLMSCQKELNEMFTSLVEYMYANLEHFGEILMVDGKAIQSFATKITKKANSGGRGEHDADWCKKTYTSANEKGEKITKTVKWFGFRLHLIADATYEMPVAFSVTKASTSEQTENKRLLQNIKEERKDLLKGCKYFLADKGYDDTKLINWLENEEIHPIIDIRNC